MTTSQRILLLTALLAQCANAQDVIGLPFGAENSLITVNAVGAGADGFTTFIASATSIELDFPFPTITFIEKGSTIIIPTATFDIPAEEGKSETIVLYESCAVGQGGVANCLVSEQIALDGTTLASAVTTSATISAYTLNASSSGKSSPSQTGSSSSQPAAGSNPSNPSTPPQSTSGPDSTTGSPTISAPTTSGTGAASKLETRIGLAVVFSSLLMLL